MVARTPTCLMTVAITALLLTGSPLPRSAFGLSRVSWHSSGEGGVRV